ncbi:MAG: CPBP family intramembrane metalloprotease, partial [Planctomycetia bacterium]|nr:CPBP family intramembrane metalloprotease [Planctomycetia bacterium]
EPAEPNQPAESDPRFFLVAVLFEAGLGVVALGIGWLVGVQPLQTWHFTIDAIGWGIAATLPMLVGLWLINRFPVGPLKALKQLVVEELVPRFRGLRLWQLAALAAAAGVGEELLLRGLVQTGLTSLASRALTPSAASAVGLILAGLLFGLMHPLSKTYATLCVLIGLYLGAIWLATGNLLVPVIAHGLYDFLALVYLLSQSPKTMTNQ